MGIDYWSPTLVLGMDGSCGVGVLDTSVYTDKSEQSVDVSTSHPIFLCYVRLYESDSCNS